MRNFKILIALSMMVLGVACGRDGSAVPPPEDSSEPTGGVAPGDEQETVDEILVPIPPVTGSTLSGQAILLRSGNETEVSLSLRGAAGSGTYEARIHRGTCAAPGAAIAALAPVTTDGAGSGSSTSTVEVAFAEMFNGDHIIAAHEPDGDPNASVLCGLLPGQTV